MIWMFIIGAVSGIISGMGIGGGTVLIPALCFLYDYQQQEAQHFNLIYFIPTAIIALVTHIKDGNIEKKVVKGLILWGLLGSVAGAFLAIRLDPQILRKCFGFFLLLMGVYEFFKKDKNNKKGDNYGSSRI